MHAQLAGAFSQPGSLVRLSEMSDRNRTCQPGRVTPHPDVQPELTTRQTPFSGRGDVPLSEHIVNKFRAPTVLQQNIEGLTASKINVLHHLAVQYEALVILLQKSHCTCANKLTIPGFILAGSFLSRKHCLATFVHDGLNGPLLISLQLHRRLSGCAWTLMVIELSLSTNLHLRDCKHLISQCSLTPFSLLATLIVHMSTGVIEPAVPMKSALLLGQASTALSLSTTQRTLPPFILADGTLAPTLIWHLSVLVQIAVYLTDAS